jgi:hypothetical protein
MASVMPKRAMIMKLMALESRVDLVFVGAHKCEGSGFGG